MSPQGGGANGWGEWKRLILASIERQDREHSELIRSLDAVRIDLAGLKVKAGIWGALAGLIPVIAAILWTLLGD